MCRLIRFFFRLLKKDSATALWQKLQVRPTVSPPAHAGHQRSDWSRSLRFENYADYSKAVTPFMPSI
jgi:hypothetical protein